jgi:nuclear receptor subfamily 5 group A protein 3
MASKRRLSMSSLLQQTDSDTSQRQIRNSSKLGYCPVCGDQAHIIHYGALSCQSCKTFFRRNASHLEVCIETYFYWEFIFLFLKTARPCLYNSTCEVNKYTRQLCTACRFDKCLRIGMSIDLIWKKHLKKARNLSSTKQITSKTLMVRIKSITFLYKIA